MKRFLMTALAAVSINAAAQQYSIPSLVVDRNPVDLSLASSTIASDEAVAFSAFRNTAALPYFKGKGDVAASFTSWAPSNMGGSHIGIGAGFHLGKRWGLAVAGSYGMGTSYEMIDDYGSSKGTFKTSSMLFAAGVGFKAAEFLSFGANLKFASEALSPDSKPSSFNVDIYAMGHFMDALNITLGVSSIGTSVKSAEGDSFAIPSSAVLGVFYPWHIGTKHTVNISADGNIYFKGGVCAAAGLQYGWNNMLFVRAGYHFGDKKAPVGSYASVGLGVKVLKGLHIDAAYILGNAVLKNSFSAGVGYSF